MITIDMLKKHLPDNVKVVNYGDKTHIQDKKIVTDAKCFICSFPETYFIDGVKKQTVFAVIISNYVINNASNDEIDALVKSRCEVSYNQALKYHEKITKNNA